MQDYHLRSFEDIEKEKDSLIDEINKNKINIENQITNVVNKLDNTIEEINKQTSLNVENTNSFRETLEKLYYSKLKSASNSLKISISVFEEKTKTLKSEFWKISAIIIILIVSLTGEIVQNNLSMNSVGQITQNNTSVSPSLTNSIIQLLLSLIPYIVILIILLSIYLVFKAYKNINSIDNISELRTEVNNIDKNMTPAPTMPHSPEKIEVEKPFFDEKKTILSSFISSVGKSIPVVSNIYDEVTLLVEYQQMVKDFEMCLEFYKLVENESFFEELGRGVPADVHILNSDNLWKNIVAKKISSQLSKQILGQKITLSENLILLLYSEHNGEPSTSIFRELVDSDDEIQALASVLIHSQKLIKSSGYEFNTQKIIKSGGYEYKIEDIAAIIRTIESFSLSNINNILSSSFLTLNYLNSYVEFLEKNDIDTSYELTIEFVINKSNNNNNSFEERVVELAYRIGLDIFNKLDNLDKDFVDGFARASIALKFHNDISLRKIACKFSATDHSTSVLYSYYEKIKENDGQKVVSIKQLISDVEIVKSFLTKLEDPDIKFFQAQLKDGKWYDSSYSLLRHFFEKSKEEISEKLLNIEEFEILKESIRSTYQEVSIETLEKSIDAQIFGAYVIMFHSSGSQNSDKRDESKKDEDTLRKIIDKLSIRDLDQNDRDNKWEFKKDREIEKITKMYGVRPKYDFINFSNSTRIGILNKNQSFQPFKKEFLNDV